MYMPLQARLSFTSSLISAAPFAWIPVQGLMEAARVPITRDGLSLSARVSQGKMDALAAKRSVRFLDIKRRPDEC